MKNLIIAVLCLSFSSVSIAQINCIDLKNEIYPQKVLSTKNLLTKKNWKNFDVIANFRFNECSDGMLQELIEVNGEKFWSLKTNNDACDGGNTYGAIYAFDLKTPVAHIYDSDIICESDWIDQYKSKSHRCDDAAETLVQNNLTSLGLKVSHLSSTLELRPMYVYSEIKVSGYLNGDLKKEFIVDVLFKVNSCLFGASTISYLPLYNNDENAWEKL
jgi:hypothetical protein